MIEMMRQKRPFHLMSGYYLKTMKGFGIRFLFVVAVLYASGQTGVFVFNRAAAAAIEPHQNVVFAPVKIEIKSSGKTHCFNGEMATSPRQHSLGLMFRKEIPPDYAMVFDFGHLRAGAMWMKNTFVSLDMLFADESRRITFIATNTVPQSEEIITSPEPVRYVLEVPGGTTKRLGINIGDSFSLGN